MTKFLLIGPSGIGKSAAVKKLMSDNSFEIYDLDSLLKEHVGTNSISHYLKKFKDENFFYKSKEVIENIRRDKDVLIAVGTGSINFVSGHKWYKTQNTIALIGIPDEIYKRCNRQQYHLTVDLYKEREFSEDRQNLYYNSKHIIDVTQLTPDQVADKISEIIKKNTANI